MDWVTLLIIPVVVIVVGLLIEYYVIQPIKQAKEIPLPTRVTRDWENAIRKAVKHFKAQQSGFENEGLFNSKKDDSKTVKVEECTVYRGKASLIVSTSYVAVSGNYLSLNPKDTQYWNVTNKYRLEIDRTGDILKSNKVDSQQIPIGGDIPPMKLSVHNIQARTSEVINGVVKVFINFDIQNEGQAGKTCPQIEYPVVFMSKNKYEPTPHFANVKQLDVAALSTVKFTWEEEFNFIDVPLVTDTSKIKVRLKPCP
ncbi:MAG: hypothetical protein QY328_03365 [Anaerolineales bacterium]|nr:MAG: hypothetical protein QY328_03365 [Anaerolineales bacterium]